MLRAKNNLNRKVNSKIKGQLLKKITNFNWMDLYLNHQEKKRKDNEYM